MAHLPSDFFARNTIEVARDLIGTVLVVGPCEGRIVETEAYTTDAASHSVMRPNKSEIMRTTFGRVYVYFIYGMYYCLNFTTDKGGAGAVLIRAAEPIKGLDVCTWAVGGGDFTNPESFRIDGRRTSGRASHGRPMTRGGHSVSRR
jgi:DNA-3-methyladenine glycosylase